MAAVKVTLATLLVTAGVIMGDTPYRPPTYHPPAPSYHPPAPSYHPPAPSYKEPGKPYKYAYSVNDDYKGLKFSADEASDGNNVKGSYQVALPDGRQQNVQYTADHHAGFIADVSYYGEAQYPPPASYHPAPAPYHPPPPPSYHG